MTRYGVCLILERGEVSSLEGLQRGGGGGRLAACQSLGCCYINFCVFSHSGISAAARQSRNQP